MCHRACRAFQLARVDSSQALFPEPLLQAKRQAAGQRPATRRHPTGHTIQKTAAQWAVHAELSIALVLTHGMNPFGRCDAYMLRENCWSANG